MATLTITGRSDVASVAADLDALGASARGVSTDVASVDDAARQSGAGLDALGAAGDDVASKSSQATGALGALAGGLEAIGATGAAAALEGTAIATDVASGAGDALNLIAETTVGKYIAQTAASIAHRTATIAGTVATGAMTVAQGALNLVMSANPIALVVIALAALAAGVIFAYQKSETFRGIIDGAFTVAKNVIGTAADAVEDIVGWFGDLPGKVSDAAGTVREKVTSMFEPVSDAIGFVGDLVDDLGGISGIASTVAGYFTNMFAPIDTALGWIESILEKLKEAADIDLPFGLGRSADTTTGPTGKPTAGGDTAGVAPAFPPVVVNLTVAPQDKDKATDDLVASLREYMARRGQTLSITEAGAY